MKTFQANDKITLTHIASGHESQAVVLRLEGAGFDKRYVVRLADGTVHRVRVRASGSFIVSSGK